ncbi:MAG: hypothetical protein HY803_13910, partial [candidate division NC10 bacterium]|nr:hypothetical protein [candidate division NC10 bacterium]
MTRRQGTHPGSRGRRPAGPPGVMLIITMLLVGLLLVMGLTLINLASSDYQIANNESRSIQALYNADAGTEEAKMRLSPTNPPTPVCSSTTPTAPKIEVGTSANWRAYVLSGHSQSELPSLDPTYGKAAPNYTTTESTSNYLYCTTVQTGSSQIPWGWARIQHKFNAAGNILYQDAITGNETTSSSQVVGSTTVYNPPIIVVTTEGIQGSVRRMISVEYQPIVSTTTTTTDVITDPFGNAAHGVGPVTLTGNATTDSYDSRLGAYNVNGNLGTNGDISTDASGANSVTIESNSVVNGDVYVGTAANPAASAVTMNGTINGGTIQNEATTWNMPLSSIPAGVVNQGPLSIAGNTV